MGVDYTALAIELIHRGRSSVGLERRPVTPEVAGSSPVAPASMIASYWFIFLSGLVFLLPKRAIR